MITCPQCKQDNMNGTLFCNECGFSIWNAGKMAAATSKLKKDDSNQSNVKAQIGTATLNDPNHVSIHVRYQDDPFTITLKDEYLIGRGDTDAGSFPDLDLSKYGEQSDGVSRSHAAFRRVDEELFVVDLGSTNGTTLNGASLTANKPYPLHDGDEVRFGTLMMHIYFK